MILNGYHTLYYDNITISGYLTWPWKSPCLIGKPSISMGHRKTMAMLNNQSVYPMNIPLNHHKFPLNHYKIPLNHIVQGIFKVFGGSIG